jgi:hypothetical protein
MQQISICNRVLVRYDAPEEVSQDVNLRRYTILDDADISIGSPELREMTKGQRDGFCLLLLGSMVLLALGFALEDTSPVAMVDFGVVYFPARSLLQHGDPYKESDVLRVYLAEGGGRLWNTARDRTIITQYEYPPSAFYLTLPFALLPWKPAHILWIAITSGGLIFSAFLLWQLCAETAPLLAGALIGFLLANSEVLIVLGNVSGIVICLCIVAVCCLIRERFVLAGILCLALALIVKPHDSAMIWLCFLLAGGTYRRRALQTLGVASATGLAAALCMWKIVPAWVSELRSNIAGLTVRGAINDPGPASAGGHGLGMFVNLHVIFSLIADNPAFYKPASYAISAVLLLVWAWAALRSRPTPGNAWLSMAAASALTMLPMYHHLYDTKLMLLAVPACAMLCARGGSLGRTAAAVTAATFVLVGDLTWTIILSLLATVHVTSSKLAEAIFAAVQVVPAPLAILLMGSFYTWMCVRQARDDVEPALAPPAQCAR